MRSVIGLCTTLGTIGGSYAPALWGASSFSLTSVLFAAVGGVAGLWLAAKVA